MSYPATSPGALQAYLDKWLAVQPQQRIALSFVDPLRYPGHLALAAWEQEVLVMAYGINEPQVAMSKLDWWVGELCDANTGGGRHVLTRVLFTDNGAHDLPRELWLAPLQAAMDQLTKGTATDFSTQLAMAESLHGALARLETAWWFGLDVSADRAVRVATLVHMLHALRRLRDDIGGDCLPLPMARLARFGLSRSQLAQSSDRCNQAIQAQLADLSAAWREAAAMAGPLSVFRGLESALSEKLACRALRASEPLSVLQRGTTSRALVTAVIAWRLARRWHQSNT